MSAAVALVASSLIIGESRATAIERDAEHRLGQVDQVALGADELFEAVHGLVPQRADGVATFHQAEIPVVAATETGNEVVPAARVTAFDTVPTGFGGDPPPSGWLDPASALPSSS